MTTTAPAILCDVDGTLYVGNTVVPGAAEAIVELRERGCALRFLSNIDSRPESGVVRMLGALGFDIQEDEIFLPATAARALLQGQADAHPLFLLSDDVRATFDFPAAGGEPVTHVLVGDCRDKLSYRLLDEAFRALDGGAQLVALQRSRYLMAEDGVHLDTGAFVAALEYASGQSALLLGKPSAEFLALAAASLGTDESDVWVVGDDATTDIAMGAAAGATTVQLRTGKFSHQAAERAAQPATYEIDSIADLPGLVADVCR